MNLVAPLISKHKDGILRVICLGRISTEMQDMASIDSQHAEVKRWLKQNYHGESQITCLGERASGWLVNRETIQQALEQIEAGECDLVIVGELRELYRNPAQVWIFLYDCVDKNTRFISMQDNLDTEDENWELMTHTGTMRHGMAVPETRKRIRRKATLSFSQGGMVMKHRFGYRKISKEEAQSGQFGPKGLRIVKCETDTPRILEMREHILKGMSATALADKLNEEGVPTGPYVKSGKWSRNVVANFLRDPILSGQRTFRKVKHIPIYKTGLYRREKSKESELEIQIVPELAHMSKQEQDEMIAVLDARAECCKAPSGKDSRLWKVPRSRTLWPGQHAHCGVCGGLMYRTGDFLRCRNTTSASLRSCWNHVQVDIEIIKSKVLDWVWKVAEKETEFRKRLADLVWEEIARQRQLRNKSENQWKAEVERLDSEAKALATAIKRKPDIDALLDELVSVNANLKAARQKLSRQQVLDAKQDGFTTREDLESKCDRALHHLADSSYDFADLIRRLIPDFVIEPIQSLDCSLVRPRARITLSLESWTDPGKIPLQTSTTIDLFEEPVHIRHLPIILDAKRVQPKASYDAIARKLSINRMTVKRALAYHRLMEEKGVSTPYLVLQSRPENVARWIKRPKMQ